MLFVDPLPPAFHQIAQTDLAEKVVDLTRQVLPQMVGQAGLALVAISFALTVRHIYRFVDRVNDLRNENLGAASRQAVVQE